MAQSRENGIGSWPINDVMLASPVTVPLSNFCQMVPSVGPSRSARYRKKDHVAPRVAKSSLGANGELFAGSRRYARSREKFEAASFLKYTYTHGFTNRMVESFRIERGVTPLCPYYHSSTVMGLSTSMW